MVLYYTLVRVKCIYLSNFTLAVPFGLTLEQADGLSNNFLGISLLKNILTVPKIEGLYFPLWVIQSDGSFGDQQANVRYLWYGQCQQTFLNVL